MEKEVLGVYISGHPLEAYEERWKKNITNKTSDFLTDEETGLSRVTDGAYVTVGGMITDKTVKYTKNNKTMAFITLEDLLGTVEIIVFPQDYEKYHHLLEMDSKVFVSGKVSAEEEKDSKLICEQIISFDDVKRELWLQFETKETYEEQINDIWELLKASDGSDEVVLYISSMKAIKRMGAAFTVHIDDTLLSALKEKLSEKNVKVLEKSIEKSRRKGYY